MRHVDGNCQLYCEENLHALRVVSAKDNNVQSVLQRMHQSQWTNDISRVFKVLLVSRSIDN